MRVGDYELGEELGRGGFGVVYRARRQDIGREDAIKILDARHCRDADAVRRFVGEARAASKIDHLGIVRVHDIGETDDGRAFIVMELLKGRTLRSLLDELVALPMAEAKPLLHKIAEAVDAAHAAGVVHRDLKPENVFVEPDGSIRVIDFGLAKLVGARDLTTTGKIMGSPRYMSPEQCRGSATDASTDLYSFGALAYHVLTGAPPFEGDALALALHHVNDSPEPPSAHESSLPPSADRVILGLLAKEPSVRPRPLAECIDRLDRFTPEPVPLPARRSRTAALALLGVAIVGLGAATAVVSRGRTAGPPRQTKLLLRDVFAVPAQQIVWPAASGTGVFMAPDEETSPFIPSTPTRVSYRAIGDSHISPVDGVPLGTTSDGRRVVAHFDSKTVEIVSASPSEPSPIDHFDNIGFVDHDALPYVRDGVLRLLDLKTGASEKLADGGAPGDAPRWSPDGKTLLWSPSRGKLQLIDRVSHEIRPLPIPYLDETNADDEAAFSDARHVVYCARENNRSTLRSHAIDGGSPDRELLLLDDNTAACGVFSTHGVLSVAVVAGRPQMGMMDTKSARPRPVPLPGPLGAAVTLAPRENSELVAVFPKTGEQLRVDAHGTATTLPTCAQRTRLVVEPKNEVLFWEAIDTPTSTSIRFFDATCKTRQEWTLPLSSVYSTTCKGICIALAVDSAGVTSIWKLLDNGVATRLGDPTPLARKYGQEMSLDVSPDGTRACLATGFEPDISVFEDGHATKTIPYRGFINGLSWSIDGDHFLATAIDPRGQWRIESIGMDGTISPVFSSHNSVWFYPIDQTADGKVYGELRLVGTTVMIFSVLDL